MTFAHLDYPPEKLLPFGRDKILMECNTDIERAMRIVACEKEKWTVTLIESMEPGEVLWDIGANVGSYTLLAAARKLNVVAFEPISESYATLCRNLALNNLLGQVITLPFALGDQDALIWAHLSDLRSGAASHTLSGSPRKQSLHQQLVPLLTATTAWTLWGLPVPHAIKIDVDGFEAKMLAGAEWLLSHTELRALLIEMHVQNDAALLAWLGERGWIVAEQYEQRGPIYYAKFERAPVPAPVSDGKVTEVQLVEVTQSDPVVPPPNRNEKARA